MSEASVSFLKAYTYAGRVALALEAAGGVCAVVRTRTRKLLALVDVHTL